LWRTSITTVLGLLAVVVLVAATAVFTAGEFSLVAVDRSSVEAAVAAGSRRARLVLSMLRRMPFQLSGTQLGVTLCSLLLGFAAEPVIGQALRSPVDAIVGVRNGHGLSVAFAFVIATISQLLLAELIPKNVAVARPQRVAFTLAPILRGYTVVFSPVISALNTLSRATVRLFGVEPRDELRSAFSATELERLVASSGREGTLDPEAARLLTRTLRFAGKTAADALVPRTSVVSIDRDASVADLAALAVSSGYSRFPVVEGDLNSVVGIVLAKDVFRVPRAERTRHRVSELMTDVLAVPERRDLEALLADMREQRRQLAVVIDEFGDAAGIVTLEDLLEELVGEIDDEYDDPPEVTAGPDGTIVLEGTARPDEVADATGLRLPDGEFETLAGFVLTQIGRIPDVGDVVMWEGWRLVVTEMDRRRVARVAITPPQGQR
jgi:CBS domain containing-hemolysin-like protein